jgi:hypothetical protein
MPQHFVLFKQRYPATVAVLHGNRVARMAH